MARLPNQKAREIYQWAARPETSLPRPKKVAEAGSVWISQGLGEAPNTHLFFFPFIFAIRTSEAWFCYVGN